jgi:glycosyltransferase involved in cell wall biosynthesis
VKLACVIHRYGAEIAGGSEAHCRQLAERLRATGHDVTVLTTCAQDYVTWANAYPPGRTETAGVAVHRFPVRRTRRMKAFANISDEVFDARAAPDRQEAWFQENGPDAPELLDYLRQHGRDFDLVLFWSYRYAPAYFGLPLVADRAVLVPTAEEDPAITLDVLEDYFRLPRGYLFLTPEEQSLVSLRAGQALEPAAIIGAGLEPAPAAPPPRALLDRLGVPAQFVLYLGRVDRNKGCHTMFEYFEEHLASGSADTTLVLAGPAKLRIPQHRRILSLGRVNDAVRDALLAHAATLLVPSPYESLSMSLLEGWNLGTPALVNAYCAVLQGQARRANGGLWYRSAREFSSGLTWLLTHSAEARALGAQGRAYVEREYRWPVVMRRVEELLDAVRR